jgi:hypothetical protein
VIQQPVRKKRAKQKQIAAVTAEKTASPISAATTRRRYLAGTLWIAALTRIFVALAA